MSRRQRTYANTEVDLTKVDVQVDDEHTNKIIIDEERKLLIMKYPTIGTVDPTKDLQGYEDKKLFDMIAMY